MIRGFIKGTLWAVVLGGVILSFVSLINEQPIFAEGPPAPQLVAPSLTVDSPTPSVSVTVAEEEAPQFAPISPRVPEPVAQETTPEITTAPVAPPQTAQVDTALDLPADTAEPELAPRADATIAGAVPQAPSTLDVQNAAPQAPLLDAGIADAPVPLVIEAAPEAENETQTTAAATPEETPAPLIVITEAAPEPSPIEPPADTESLAVADVPAQAQAAPAPAPAPVAETPAPAPVAETPAPLIAEVAQMPEVFTPEPAPVVTETVQDAGAEPATQPGPAVRINRPGAVPAAPLDDAAESVDADTVPADAPALLRFAAPFENPENLPLISVILLDEGAMSDMAQAIAALPFSPTIVVDALAENAGSRAAIYRAAAAEVAVQLSLPAGAQPTDVEVAFEAAFGIVPEATVLFSDGTGTLQDDRRVTTQVMQILAAEGRGFVSVQRGLGNALRVAGQESVPVATILRDFDGAGEDAGAMTRALDQAAFRARQTGAAVLLGRLTPQTLAVLADWSSDIDTQTLLIAPTSAILLAQDE